MLSREATHAGLWYSKDRSTLSRQIRHYFSKTQKKQQEGARVLVGPHAGYTYCGQQLAEAYSVWDSRAVRRVFILGPSHHAYFKNTARLSPYAYYDTPLGHVPVDTHTCESLVSATQPLLVFSYMSESDDDEEHSFEMHLPFLVQKCHDTGVEIPLIVPVMISGLSAGARCSVVAALSPYFDDPHSTFVILSDFCHWGRRFGYLAYVPTMELALLTEYKRSAEKSVPVYKSIEYLDRSAMLVASAGSVAKWDAYIDATGNTICGQKPIAIVLLLLEKVRQKRSEMRTTGETAKSVGGHFQWLGYSQSNKAMGVGDHSVSYAAGYVVL